MQLKIVPITFSQFFMVTGPNNFQVCRKDLTPGRRMFVRWEHSYSSILSIPQYRSADPYYIRITLQSTEDIQTPRVYLELGFLLACEQIPQSIFKLFRSKLVINSNQARLALSEKVLIGDTWSQSNATWAVFIAWKTQG